MNNRIKYITASLGLAIGIVIGVFIGMHMFQNSDYELWELNANN